jgi:CcmD family protein
MRYVVRIVTAGLVLAALGAAAPVTATAQPAETDQTQAFEVVDPSEFQEQLPAAPLLIAAYMFVLLALFAYVLSVAKRLGGVSDEVRRLEDELKRRGARG